MHNAQALATVIASALGATGTVLSAYLVVRVQKVQSTVNGHTAKLEAELEELRQELELRRRRAYRLRRRR